MNGRRLRERRDYEAQVVKYFDNRPIEEAISYFEEELESGVCAWRGLERKLESYQAGLREMMMAQNLLQWRAREAYWCFTELELLRSEAAALA